MNIKASGVVFWGGFIADFAVQAELPQTEDAGGEDAGQFAAALWGESSAELMDCQPRPYS